jgi:hypothetical protein
MSEFFVRRPIVAIVIAILMTLIGGVCILALPIAQYPQIASPEPVLGNVASKSSISVKFKGHSFYFSGTKVMNFVCLLKIAFFQARDFHERA